MCHAVTTTSRIRDKNSVRKICLSNQLPRVEVTRFSGRIPSPKELCGLVAIFALSFLSFWAFPHPLTWKHAAGLVDESIETRRTRISRFNEKVPRGCLSLDFEEDMDYLLSISRQTFVMMPAKAAGSSLKTFTRECMKAANTTSFAEIDNVLTLKHGTKSALLSQLEMPSLITSHMYDSEFVVRLVRHATAQSLIIFSYREETSRLISAIKHIVASRFCVRNGDTQPGVMFFNSSCRVQEYRVTDAIQRRMSEIRSSTNQLLTCETYETIRDHRPNLVFMHFKQASRLQKLLAKHHCPDVSDIVVKNVGSEKMPVSVVLGSSKNNGTLVGLDEYLNHKAQLLPYVFNMNMHASCTGITRAIEEDLLACPSETLSMRNRYFGDDKGQV